MWNTSFVMPNVMILSIILLFYFMRPRLPIRMNSTFLILLLMDILTILFDYISTKVDENFASHAVATGWALNMAFFVFYLARIFWFSLFTLDVLEANGPLPKGVRRAAPAVFILSELAVLSSPVTHAVFSYDAGGYHRGFLYNILYICFFFYLFFSLVVIRSRARRLPLFELASLLLCHGILFVGNLLRILYPQVLVMNVFCLMAILVIYLSFENPDLYRTDRGNAYNTRGFLTLLGEWHEKKPYRVLGISLRNYYELRGIFGGSQMDQCVSMISTYLSERYPDAYVFDLRNGCFAIMGTQAMDCVRMSRELHERFRQPWETESAQFSLEAAFVQAEPEAGLYSADRVSDALVIALTNAAQAERDGEDGVHLGTIHAIDRDLNVRRTLERALDRDTLEVFLQPLVDSGSGRLRAAEALARLRDEDGTLIPPNVFIPIAEHDGHIVRLGEQLLRKVCRFLAESAPPPEKLSWINVNLSPRQCLRKDLAARFTAILEEYHIPAERIHLEITEQSILDYGLLKEQILGLQAAGFQFSLDDYGTGYSNLTRVRQYPFNNIKLDMEVVWDYCRNRDLLLPSLVQAFKQMGFTITAEGIETREMAETLREIGCDFLQGYYFSRPIPFPEFLEKYGNGAAGN